MFTVITTSFYDEKAVNSYLDAITHQSLLPDELIVVDGGSKDKTCEIIKEYAKASNVPIRCIQRGRLNIAQAFNIGIKESKSEYVLITCMGNRFSSTMCEDLYQEIVSNNADASYGLLMGVDKGNFSKLYNRAFIGEAGNDIMSNRSVMYRKDVFSRIGYFIENFKYAGEDSEFLNRFDKNNLKRCLVNKPTVYWETPNSWTEYIKQCKNYAIAELQHADILRCFINRNELKWYLMVISLLVAPACWQITVIGLLFLCFKICKGWIQCRSLKVAVLKECNIILKIYYSWQNIKYCTKKYRVV